MPLNAVSRKPIKKSAIINANCLGLAHLPCSLEKLALTLRKSKCDFKILRQLKECHDVIIDEKGEEQLVISEEKLDLMTQKSIFPYHMCTSISRLKSVTTFPPRENFVLDLMTGKPQTVSLESWQRGAYVWQRFGIESLYEYLLLYLRIDTALLGNSQKLKTGTLPYL